MYRQRTFLDQIWTGRWLGLTLALSSWAASPPADRPELKSCASIGAFEILDPSQLLGEIETLLGARKGLKGQKQRLQKLGVTLAEGRASSDDIKEKFLERLTLQPERFADPRSLMLRVLGNPLFLNTDSLAIKTLEALLYDTPLRKSVGRERGVMMLDLIDRKSFSVSFLQKSLRLFEAQGESRKMWEALRKHVKGYLLPETARQVLPIPDEFLKPLRMSGAALLAKVFGPRHQRLSRQQRFRRALLYLAQAHEKPQQEQVMLLQNLLSTLEGYHSDHFRLGTKVITRGKDVVLCSEGCVRYVAISKDGGAFFGGFAPGTDVPNVENLAAASIFSVELSVGDVLPFAH